MGQVITSNVAVRMLLQLFCDERLSVNYLVEKHSLSGQHKFRRGVRARGLVDFSEPRGLANIRADVWRRICESHHPSRQLGVCHQSLLIGAQACHEIP